MADIFISYSHSDRNLLDELVSLLRIVYNNDSVWFDDDIRGGDDWWARILLEIYKCKLFIFLVSDSSLASEYCQNEMLEAIHLSRRVLPIILNTFTGEKAEDALANIDDQLRSIQFITLKNGFDNSLDMAKLWGAVNSTDFEVNLSLSKKERWLLRNQYMILDKLYPDNEFSTAIKVMENGYEFHYDMITPFFDSESMSEDDCIEVLDILAMFDFMERAINSIGNISGIDENAIKNIGFDGNNEGKYRGYLKFLVEEEQRFNWLSYANKFNTHYPVLETYRRMLLEWKKSNLPYQLTKEDILRIINARYNR